MALVVVIHVDDLSHIVLKLISLIIHTDYIT